MAAEKRRPLPRDWELCRRLLGHGRGSWRHVGGLAALSLLGMPLALLTPLPLKLAVDCVLGGHPLPGWLANLLPGAVTGSATALLAAAAALFVMIALGSKLQELGVAVWSTATGERLVRNLRARVFGHAQRLSLLYHDTRGTSDSLYRIQYDTPAIRHFIIDGVIPLVTSTVTVTGMIWVSMEIDWQLALVALGVTPLLVLAFLSYRKRIRRSSRELKKHDSGAFSVIQEVLGAVRVVKAFGQEDREEERFADRAELGVRAHVRYTLTEGSFGLLVGAIMAAGTGLVLFLGVQHVAAGSLSLGNLLMLMAYLAQLYAPLKTLSAKAGSLQAHLESAERVFAILDETPDVPEIPGAYSLERARGEISFRDVNFAYGEGAAVIEGVSFEVAARSKVGIAGPTGAGKTTLLSLLTRFYDPTGGAITLDGIDLREYRVADLRNQFAIVLQEPVLFSTTIYENIAYARPEATRAEIEEAAKLANAHGFISRLKEGYATRVGERGMRLSGGERQRVSLARAFLKDAPILILDEPTSSVDTKTEAGIMEAIDRLMAGRTTFIIAHRLSTLSGCDVRLNLEAGRLVEEETGALGGGSEAAVLAGDLREGRP